jgi:hypothetical protein
MGRLHCRTPHECEKTFNEIPPMLGRPRAPPLRTAKIHE